MVDVKTVLAIAKKEKTSRVLHEMHAQSSSYTRLFNASRKGMTSCRQSHLLVDPLVDGARVRDCSILLAEPEGNLSLGRLRRV